MYACTHYIQYASVYHYVEHFLGWAVGFSLVYVTCLFWEAELVPPSLSSIDRPLLFLFLSASGPSLGSSCWSQVCSCLFPVWDGRGIQQDIGDRYRAAKHNPPLSCRVLPVVFAAGGFLAKHVAAGDDRSPILVGRHGV